MENIKEYKSKYSYINKFFWSNNVFLMKADTSEKDKIIYQEIDYKNKKGECIILNNKVSDKKRFEILKTIVFSKIDSIKLPDYLYVKGRYNLNENLCLSKKLNINVKKIDNRLKYAYVTYNYFKIKDLIERQGFDSFFLQYKLSRTNEYLNSIYKKVDKGIIKKNYIEDYFYISTIKNIIHIYSKEINNKIDYENPPFDDRMLFKYLDNYFSKFVIIDYNKEKIKNFISKYYITEKQSEDHVCGFVDNFLFLYKIITNINLSYETKHKLNFKKHTLFNTRKPLEFKFKNFFKYFDKIVEDDENYYNFLFILEILELNKHHSDKKDIINYTSVFDLLLVKDGDKRISNQIQNKCMMLLKYKGYTHNELKIIYDYRSKIIHGEYKSAINKLHELSLLDKYKSSEEEAEYENYYSKEQILEEKIRNQLFNILKVILRCFVINNNYIKQLKNKTIIQENK